MLDGLLRMENGPSGVSLDPIHRHLGRRDGSFAGHCTRCRTRRSAHALALQSGATSRSRCHRNQTPRGREVVCIPCHVECSPAKVPEVHASLAQELEVRAHIRLHLEKTEIWNRRRTVPAGVAELTAAARRVKPDAVVWRGDVELPLERQGMRVLGTPNGRPEFVQHFLARKMIRT